MITKKIHNNPFRATHDSEKRFSSLETSDSNIYLTFKETFRKKKVCFVSPALQKCFR